MLLAGCGLASGMLRQPILDSIPGLFVDDRRVLPFVNLTFVTEPADIDGVREYLIEMSPADESAAGHLALAICAKGKTDVLRDQEGIQLGDASDLEIAREKIAYDYGVLLDDVQRAILDPVAERDNASHPNAALFRGGDLVADALAGDLTLELGEGQQNVEGEPAHAGRGVEGLGHRDEGDAILVEHLHQFGEVGKRPRQPVDLVNDDDVDALGAHHVEQRLERRPLHRSPGIAAIVEAVAEQLPAFMSLAFDIGL